MEESFELLSSMSPKVKGGQKTLKIKQASKLALRKHFRRSSIFDKARPVKNEDLAIVELNTDSSESTASSKEDKNNIVVIDSTDSEDENPKCLTNNENRAKNKMVQQWLYNVEEDKKSETFFSQVSTIFGDEAPNRDNDGDRIAACSTFTDYLNHRFDELFINKKKDVNSKSKEDYLSNDSFSLGLDISLTSKLKEHNNSKNSGNAEAQSLEKDGACKDAVIINETLLTSDESVLKTPPKGTFLTGTPKDRGFVTIRKNRDKKITPECVTPSGQNVEEVESMLDTFYGTLWRKNQQRVLLPMSEPKKKEIRNKKATVPNTERVVKPKIKGNLLDLKPATKKLNFDRLSKPVKSPWIQKLKGLVDSDSDGNNTDSGGLESNSQKPKGLEMVKIRLDFDEDSRPAAPAITTTNKTKKLYKPIVRETDNNKENNSNNVNRKLIRKPENTSNKNTKKNVETRTTSSSSSTKSWSEEDISTDDEYDKQIEILEITRKSMLPVKHKTYSFLESLSGSVPIHKCDTSARIFRTNYKEHKEQLSKKLFAIFNEKVFDNAIPKDTEIEWNINLRKTAGSCRCKKITHRKGNVERKVNIALSTKVLDSADRLRDTLVHEMCHAATWIVNQVSDGHGAYWKGWAFKAMEVFPELPPIKRCHAYTINSKYTYKCTGCGYSFGRHSKSVDTERKRCGLCYGKFEVLLNKITKNGETKTVAVTPRKEATGFALFVKENYALYKEPSKKHGDVMRILGQKFAELKVKSTG